VESFFREARALPDLSMDIHRLPGKAIDVNDDAIFRELTVHHRQPVPCTFPLDLTLQ
jgi:hypothetical protein